MTSCGCFYGPSGSKTCDNCIDRYNVENSEYKEPRKIRKEEDKCKICGSRRHSWETCPTYINLYNESIRQYDKSGRLVKWNESVLDTLLKRRQRNFSKKSRKSKNAKRKKSKSKSRKSKH
jgi:hypothetical protein